ncbi:putative carboxylesterase [Helianthus annuus]|uniref:Carboxylesterase n=1 Tax=Helianthus annuus TaxID=4232 RepID=A0A9K3J1H7_HELAN|nr:putative carboxylesterase [Helianthus annuus]KAJ0585683.1 putative carboxylesterase [Helianthus annuus]KAJ0923921.1 putative carboxylesterase [Helianthus annuus]
MEVVKLSPTNEHIKETWILSMKAHNHEEDYVKKASMDLLIVAFKGSMEVDDFYQGDHFGETNVDDKLFPSLQRLAEGQLAKVNGLALQKFKELLNNAKFKSEVEAAIKKGKNILLTGHSFGGALASLATLWMLDQYTRILKSEIQIGCVTFGSPLLPNEDQSVAQFAHESLTENFGYEEEVNNNGLQLENRVNLKDLNDHLLTSKSTRGDSKALFELNASAKWCLLAVEEAEKRKVKNMDQIKKSMKNYNSNVKESTTKIIEDLLGEVMEYKNKRNDGSVDYYEAFKLQNEHEDFKANVNRLEQAKIWDVIVEMVRRKDLPDEFEVWDELVELGTRFRRVYEPLDIANYYRHFKGDDTGAKYMVVRPKRYKFTQRWHQHANVTGFELVSESNFVAEVEELMNEVIKPKNKTIGQVENDLESLKNKIKGWKCDEKIAKEYVFWGESVLTKLEKKLAEAKQT